MSVDIKLFPVTAFQQNCALVTCLQTNKAVVIDPGGNVDGILDMVKSLGVELESIWITHGHLDHCSGAKELRERASVPIIGPHKDDAFWIDQLPVICANYGFPHAEPFVPEQWLTEGDKVTVGNVSFDVLHCPGHTPGHVVFANTDIKVAFVGDVLFKGGIGRTDFPRSNHQDLIDSIENKLWPLGDDMTFSSGHGPTSSFGHERATNPFLNNPMFG